MENSANLEYDADGRHYHNTKLRHGSKWNGGIDSKSGSASVSNGDRAAESFWEG